VNLTEFDALCGGMKGTRMVVQWGASHVWKVGEKMFASGNEGDGASFVFKTTQLSYEILLQQGLAARAAYLTRGGWVQVKQAAMADADLAAYLQQSYVLVVAGLPKAAKLALR
jgi:predicted DNA-binding protein (MmcQ/YjbR family)